MELEREVVKIHGLKQPRYKPYTQKNKQASKQTRIGIPYLRLRRRRLRRRLLLLSP
jgi:hypothetical protein